MPGLEGRLLLLLVVEVVVVVAAAGVVRAQGEGGECYEAPTCLPNRTAYDPVTGFSNNTGWDPAASADEDGEDGGAGCCDICMPGMDPVVCFDADDDTSLAAKECAEKTGDGDWDYVMLDQLYLPQWCTGLHQGHDITLTHTERARCVHDERRTDGFGIHGLWPNYVGGYPQCCAPPEENDGVPTLRPDEVLTWDILPEMEKHWVEVTVSDRYCAMCYMWNHEFQKHGSCFGTSAYDYFATTLRYLDELSAQTQALTALAAQARNVSVTDGMVPRATIEALYPKRVQIICDAADMTTVGNAGAFLEIRTCWLPDGNLVDCPVASDGALTVNCPENVMFANPDANPMP